MTTEEKVDLEQTQVDPVQEPDPVLDLLVLADLPSDYGFKITTQEETKFFFYVNSHRWSLLERAKFQKLWQDRIALEEQIDENVTEEQSAKYELVSKQIVQMICPTIPDSLLSELSYEQRQAIVLRFFTLSSELSEKTLTKPYAMALAEIGRLLQKSIGERSSQTSKRRITGSRKRG